VVKERIKFPDHFRFGTSTSAVQVETADGHDWMGYESRDKTLFHRTTDHELRWEEDVDIITALAPAYRMSLMWSRLQRAPMAPLDEESCRFYHKLLERLRSKGVDIMLVIHHFSNPVWFNDANGWAGPNAVKWWLDYVAKLVKEFGAYVTSWNTFNEPNLYLSLGSLAGIFPPRRRNLLHAWRVLGNLGPAHAQAYSLIHAQYPAATVGISHNAAVFSADNLLGRLPAAVSDWWYMRFVPDWFEKCDFFGLSYYARIGFNPGPVTELETPGRLRKAGKLHDDMWEYYPEGLLECIRRYHTRYGKPIVVTENGVCTNNDEFRIRAIREYLRYVHQALSEGIDVRAYYHWSAWDNFEWHLGPSYRFGLYSCDAETMNRTKKPSADFYSRIAYSRSLVD